jgi:hypothetical protein
MDPFRPFYSAGREFTQSTHLAERGAVAQIKEEAAWTD